MGCPQVYCRVGCLQPSVVQFACGSGSGLSEPAFSPQIPFRRERGSQGACITTHACSGLSCAGCSPVPESLEATASFSSTRESLPSPSPLTGWSRGHQSHGRWLCHMWGVFDLELLGRGVGETSGSASPSQRSSEGSAPPATAYLVALSS